MTVMPRIAARLAEELLDDPATAGIPIVFLTARAELRDRARRELGPKFDIKEFHDVVLNEGALPLDILEKNVDRWVAERKGPS